MCCELETKRKISRTGGKVNEEETDKTDRQTGVGGRVGGRGQEERIIMTQMMCLFISLLLY